MRSGWKAFFPESSCSRLSADRLWEHPFIHQRQHTARITSCWDRAQAPGKSQSAQVARLTPEGLTEETGIRFWKTEVSFMRWRAVTEQETLSGDSTQWCLSGPRPEGIWWAPYVWMDIWHFTDLPMPWDGVTVMGPHSQVGRHTPGLSMGAWRGSWLPSCCRNCHGAF